MSTAPEQVGFRLLKKTYEVACAPDQRQSLDQAIQFLQTQAEKVQEADANASMDRLAVVTALNLSHEYLRVAQETPDALLERIGTLSAKVQETLDRVGEANLA